MVALTRYKTVHAFRLAASHLGLSEDALEAHIEAGLWHCGHCGQWLPVSAFHYLRSNGRPQGYCAECTRVSGRERYQVKVGNRPVRYRAPKQPKPTSPRGRRTCGYCNRAGADTEITLEGKTWLVHGEPCAKQARAFVYGEPQRDPVVEQ
jgi:hypothetical protein